MPFKSVVHFPVKGAYSSSGHATDHEQSCVPSEVGSIRHPNHYVRGKEIAGFIR